MSTTVLDTTALSLLLLPANANQDHAAVSFARERIETWVQTRVQEGGTVIIPAPVLSEFLVRAGDGINDLLKEIRTSRWFQVVGFDSAAAVELAIRTTRALAAGDKREGLKADWTKIKFDRQIVAIAIVAGATEILSDDQDVHSIGERWGIKVIRAGDLPLPKALQKPSLLEGIPDLEMD